MSSPVRKQIRESRWGAGEWDVEWKLSFHCNSKSFLACGEIVLSKHVTIRTDLSHEYYLVIEIILQVPRIDKRLLLASTLSRIIQVIIFCICYYYIWITSQVSKYFHKKLRKCRKIGGKIKTCPSAIICICMYIGASTRSKCHLKMPNLNFAHRIREI